MIEDFTDRHHAFEGCFNFRDIGGYPTRDGQTVRWGRYYRAGRQDRMTAEDRARLADLGIRTQIDLRKPEEIADQGRGPLPDMGSDYHNIAVIPDGGTDQLSKLVGDTGISGKRYLGYLEFGPESWLKLFEILANAETQPMLLHCTAGKDRAGTAAAMVLMALGVPQETVFEDYLLTNQYWDRGGREKPGMDAETVASIFAARPEYLEAAIGAIEGRYGSVHKYLEDHLGLDVVSIFI